MRTNSAFVIDPSHYPKGITISVKSLLSKKHHLHERYSDELIACAQNATLNRSHIKVRITRNSGRVDYIYAIILIPLIFLSVVLITIAVSLLGFVYDWKWLDSVKYNHSKLLEAIVNEDVTEQKYATENKMKTNIVVADLSRKVCDVSKSVEIFKKSELYWVLVFIIGLYYSIPAFQLVITANPTFDKSDQDECFFNYLCIKPLGNLTAFNSVFSNIGYVTYGFLYICLVSSKRWKMCKAAEKIPGLNIDDFGARANHGLCYGLGLSMIMEGIMSALYHTCPKRLYFQFDTTFMYLIGILCLIKLYHSRHPDVSAGAIPTMLLMGIILTFEAISYYQPNKLFWSVFCFV